MDTALYLKIISDKSVINLKKLKYKYPDVDMEELIDLFRAGVYKTLPIPDFSGSELVYMENAAKVRMSAVKQLLKPQGAKETFGRKAMEEEIASTLIIEGIDFTRDSVRRIFRGFAPADESENRIYGLKKGLEFISDPQNEITEESIFTLYDRSVGQYLSEENRLRYGWNYRNDNVYVVGREMEHTGLPHEKLPEYMGKLVSFIREDAVADDLLKAAAIHFYIAYLHPYFDGNGRMARLLHLWYLKRQGYSSVLFVPFSSYIEQSRKKYYGAFSLAEENAEISGVMDITPFLVYFIENVYNRIESALPQPELLDTFRKALDEGRITEKEKDLWSFALSAYGDGEFSTKQLERDFGAAAYATIRGFVMKFEELGLLQSRKYGNKVKYQVRR